MSLVNDNTVDRERLPLVSVVIPTHNRANLLKTALDSVYAQEGIGASFELEVIVVDDASSDNTPDVVLRYPAKFIRHETNQGASAARNSGIKASQGKYVAFLDDDDLFLPHKLRVQVPLLESNPEIGVVYGQIAVTGDAATDAWPESGPSGRVFEAFLTLTDDFMSPDSLLVRREVFEKAGCFDTSLPTMEHYDMYLRWAFHYPFLFLPGPVASGRFSLNGKWYTNIKNGGNERTLPHIIEKALRMLPNIPESDGLRRAARVAVFSTIAGQRWELGGVDRVRPHLLATLEAYPWMIDEPRVRQTIGRVAGGLASKSEKPFVAVQEFWKELKVVVAGLRITGSWRMLQLYVGLWIDTIRQIGRRATLKALARSGPMMVKWLLINVTQKSSR